MFQVGSHLAQVVLECILYLGRPSVSVIQTLGLEASATMPREPFLTQTLGGRTTQHSIKEMLEEKNVHKMSGPSQFPQALKLNKTVSLYLSPLVFLQKRCAVDFGNG